MSASLKISVVPAPPTWHQVPLCYTWFSRLKTYRGVLGFVCSEALPLTLVLWLVYSFSLAVVVLMVAVFWSTYEIGYLKNDRQELPEGGRLPADILSAVNVRRFVITRVVIFLLFEGLLATFEGPRFALWFGVLTLVAIALLNFHSSTVVATTRLGKLGTFATLAAYKYLPIVIPVVGWREGMKLILVVFLTYGLSRILVYCFRKFGDPMIGKMAEDRQILIQVGCFLGSAPLVLGVFGKPLLGPLSGPVFVWLAYGSVYALGLFARIWRRRGLLG